MKRGFSGRALAAWNPVSRRKRQQLLPAAAAALGMLAATTVIALSQTEPTTYSPHLDPDHGVLRVSETWAPRGSCSHCHLTKGDDEIGPPSPGLLFAENTNQLCYAAGGCHQPMPVNYPATESSRIPAGFPDAGYFEHNAGGTKVHGVEYRNRWPGQAVYENNGIAGPGPRYFSPHHMDPDMPKIDGGGSGACANCHYAHGSANPFDLLVDTYRGIGGSTSLTFPTQYKLCFNCHSAFGPPGMESSGRMIADYYDPGINPDRRAGHQIRMNRRIAISWPAHVRVGDKLPCQDCHNPHGSRGHNGAGPNAYLISDERPGWANLTDTKTNPEQNRRFCLGCHIPADGVPGTQQVGGIVMNTLPSRPEHRSTSIEACFECHGADYSTSDADNVHHPGKGN